MIQNESPWRPLPTGTRRGLPERHPRVSRIASPSGLTPTANRTRTRGLMIQRWTVRTSSTFALRLTVVRTSSPAYPAVSATENARLPPGTTAYRPQTRAMPATVPVRSPRGTVIRLYCFIRLYYVTMLQKSNPVPKQAAFGDDAQQRLGDRGLFRHRI